MTTTIVLVRHAHAVWTPDEGRMLSAEGCAGAKHVAKLLRREPVSAIYASTARRAIQTVEPLAAARGLAVTTVADLRERRLSSVPVDDHAVAVAWCWAHPAVALPGGESNLAARARGASVIAELARYHAGETIVGTHGNLLALILQHWQPAMDHTCWSRLTMPDLYALAFHDDGTSTIVQLWDAAGHFLPLPQADH